MKKTEDGSILYCSGDKVSFISSCKNNGFIIKSGTVVRSLIQIIPEGSNETETILSTAVFPDKTIAKEGLRDVLSKRIAHIDNEKEALQQELAKFSID